jgi:hypothetical protein
VHALASILAAAAATGAFSFGACHARGERPAGASSAKDEVWLSDEDIRRLQVTTEEVKLEEVDETLVTVGPVVAAEECPAKTRPEERKSCVVVAVEQSALAQVHVETAATARTTELLHDAFAGKIAWIAGALDSSGRTVKVACLFADPMAELRAGKHVRVELVVGARPAFAVSRAAVLQTRDGTFVFTAQGTAEDGRHKFARVAVGAEGDTGGPWLPVTDLQPGSLVVRRGAQSLASMLAVTAL